MVGIAPLGANFAKAYAAADFKVGQKGQDESGGEYIFCSFASASAAEQVVSIDEANAAVDLTTTTAGALEGQSCGINEIAIAAGEWGWVKVYGTSIANSASSNAANAQQAATSTAGRLDDAVGTGTFDLLGIVATAAESSNSIAVMLHYPRIAEVANA